MSSFRRKTAAAQQRAWASAGFTLLLALVVLNSAWLAATAVAIFVAAPFALDALRHARAAVRHALAGQPFLYDVASTVGNLAAVAGVAVIGRYAVSWVLAIAAGIRLLGVTFDVAAAPAFVDGPARIQRLNRERMTTVTANIADGFGGSISPTIRSMSAALFPARRNG